MKSFRISWIPVAGLGILGVMCGTLLPGSAHADVSAKSPMFQVMGMGVGVKPSALGLELGAGVQFQPIPEKEFLLGPRVSGLWATGDDKTRFDLNTGVEATLWLVNAIGPGLAMDLVAPSSISGEELGIHFRFVPQTTVRLLHFNGGGAWALRLGIPYDTHYKWGIQAGVVLEINGVPHYSDDSL